MRPSLREKSNDNLSLGGLDGHMNNSSAQTQTQSASFRSASKQETGP